MRCTCNYLVHMGGMIQIRNVPSELHRKLKARAAMAGLSLSDYLLAEIRRSAEVPSREEIVERLRRLPHVDIGESAAEVIRAGRREREEQLVKAFSAPRPPRSARGRR